MNTFPLPLLKATLTGIAACALFQGGSLAQGPNQAPPQPYRGQWVPTGPPQNAPMPYRQAIPQQAPQMIPQTARYAPPQAIKPVHAIGSTINNVGSQVGQTLNNVGSNISNFLGNTVGRIGRSQNPGLIVPSGPVVPAAQLPGGPPPSFSYQPAAYRGPVQQAPAQPHRFRPGMPSASQQRGGANLIPGSAPTPVIPRSNAAPAPRTNQPPAPSPAPRPSPAAAPKPSTSKPASSQANTPPKPVSKPKPPAPKPPKPAVQDRPPEPKKTTPPPKKKVTPPAPKPPLPKPPAPPEPKKTASVPPLPGADPDASSKKKSSSPGPSITPAGTVDDTYPTAQKAARANRVVSPHEPFNELDITGLQSGQLAIDPTTKKVFRVP